MGFCWFQLSEGKRTIDTGIGRSIVDCVFASSQARRSVRSTKVCEAEWAAGSDHRVISCDTECDIHLDDPVLSPPNSFSQRASRQKEFCYESRQILMDRAAETDRLLKKTVRQRKRDCL